MERHKSARLDDPWPYAFSTLCRLNPPKVATGRSPVTSLPLRAEHLRAFEISFFEQRPGVWQIEAPARRAVSGTAPDHTPLVMHHALSLSTMRGSWRRG